VKFSGVRFFENKLRMLNHSYSSSLTISGDLKLSVFCLSSYRIEYRWGCGVGKSFPERRNNRTSNIWILSVDTYVNNVK